MNGCELPRSSSRRRGKKAAPASEPPQTLHALRQQCPTLKWGGNLAGRPRPSIGYSAGAGGRIPPAAAAAGSAGAPPSSRNGLPDSYLAATRRDDDARPMPLAYARSHSRAGESRTSSVPRTPKAARSRSSSAHRRPRSETSGVYNTPRSERSGSHRRPNTPSSRLSDCSSQGFFQKPAFKSSVQKANAFGSFLSNAVPLKNERANTRQRSPPSRPLGPPKLLDAKVPSTKHTQALLLSMEDRSRLDREMREVYVDPTKEMAPDLDDYLAAEHSPANHMAPTVVSTSHHSKSLHATGGSSVLSLRAALNASHRTGTSAVSVAEIEDDLSAWPLHSAARRGQLDLVKELLSDGADPLAVTDKGTPLEVACEEMERAALNGTDVRGLQETVEYLNEVMDKAMRDQAAAGAENQSKKELLGSEIYSQILSAVPKKGWDSIIDILPREDLVKLASCCKGLHLLTKSKLEVTGGRTMGAASPETEELAVALFNLHALGRQRVAEATEREPPGTGYLRVLQAVCVLLTGERVDLTRVWSCADYLFHETNPMVKLAEKVRDPEQVTSQQAVWILDMFAAHADDMALACDEVLGALFSLVVCLMQCLRAKRPELPPLHLPDGYTPCSDRNNNKSKAVSSLLD